MVYRIEALHPSFGRHYDVGIVTLGYERRARFLIESGWLQADRFLALGFPDADTFSYRENQKYFLSLGVAIHSVDDLGFERWWATEGRSLLHAPTCRKLAIDISSLSRRRLGIIMESLFELERSIELRVDFLYSLASFVPPIEDSVIDVCEPITPFFAGWHATDAGDEPTGVVLGVGYEKDRAVGVLEYLQAGPSWVFVPHSGDAYDKAVNRANRALWKMTAPDMRLPYNPRHIFDLVAALDSLVSGIEGRYRAVIVPLGPKIFALASLMVACLHYPKVGVWRVSPGEIGAQMDRAASGEVVGISIVIPINSRQNK